MYKLTAEERERALSLLMKVMAIPSVNGVSREADVADYLKSYFSDTGYPAKVQQIDEKRGNFILEVPGEETDHYMVWNGHMDTVPYGDESAWATDPAVPVIKEDGRLYGRGASDMKSGLCAMAFALHLLAERGVKPRETVRFLFFISTASTSNSSGGRSIGSPAYVNVRFSASKVKSRKRYT